MPILELENVSFTYPQSKEPAVKDINISVNSGDYIALVGSNGSGKSTIARIMAGFIEPENGMVKTDSDTLPGIVFQQPKDQIVAGIVERDTAFGPQNLNLSKDEIELRTIECLSVVGMADRASSHTFELSLGQTQRIAFSGILSLFPDLLILDEVTAMLDPDARLELIKFIDQWNTRGHTIIHVTHDADEALRAKRIIVLDKGSIIFNGTKEEFKKNTELFNFVLGKKITKENFISRPSPQSSQEKEILLEAQNLSFKYPDRTIFENLNFTLYKGELVALTGPSGCGKSTLLETLAGLHDFTGNIYAKERPALSLQESDAALFAPYAADDVAFGPKNFGVKGKTLVNRVKNSMELSGLPYKDFANRSTFALSGGEKRKLSLAGIIALDSDIILFDEPTSALDAASREQILHTLRHLADSGKTVLFSTHRTEEALISDRELKWKDLTNNSSEKEKHELQSELPPSLKPFKNISLLKKLSRIGKCLISPPDVPDSLVTRLPACIKLMLFLAFLITTIIVKPIQLNLIVMAVTVLYSLLARYPLKKPLYALWKLLPWLLIFAVLEFILYPLQQNDKIIFEYGSFIITNTKIFLSARMLVRAVSLIFTTGTFIYTTSEREILDGLAALLSPLSLLKIPIRYVVLITGILFRFVPLLMDELSGIVKTQMIRGAFGNVKGFKKLGMLISLFIPLVLQSYRKAQNLADALTARYFS